jgi:hypothetical protein
MTFFLPFLSVAEGFYAVNPSTCLVLETVRRCVCVGVGWVGVGVGVCVRARACVFPPMESAFPCPGLVFPLAHLKPDTHSTLGPADLVLPTIFCVPFLGSPCYFAWLSFPLQFLEELSV